MRIALGSDEEPGLLGALEAYLAAPGHEVDRTAVGAEWPDVGRLVGARVAAGEAERAIVCCHTGTGVAIAANKVPGVAGQILDAFLGTEPDPATAAAIAGLETSAPGPSR